MGGAASFVGYSGIRKDWLDVFTAMKFKHGEVRKLFDLFNLVDADRSGTVDVVELLTLLDIERTTFAERIFAAFDKDSGGKIDFYEFVVSLWKFCTLGDGAINVFAFDIYDSDGDGKLTIDQAQKMFREMFGLKATLENEAVKAGLVELLKHALDKHVDIDVFRVYSKTHQALLYPIFSIQDKLKISTLGSMVWDSIAKRHIQIHKGKTLPIKELMVLHSDRKQFHAILEDKTILRVSSMMRIVLDATDTARHYKPAEPPTPALSPTAIVSPRRLSNNSTHSMQSGPTVHDAHSVHTVHTVQSGAQNSVHSVHSVHSVPHSVSQSVHSAGSPGSAPPTAIPYHSGAAIADDNHVTTTINGTTNVVLYKKARPSTATHSSPSNVVHISASARPSTATHAPRESTKCAQSDKFVDVSDLHLSGPVQKVRLSTKLVPRASAK